MPSANVETVLRIHRAVARREGEDGLVRWHDGMRRWLGELHDLYDEFEMEVLETREVGERVAIAFLVRGRGRGSGTTRSTGPPRLDSPGGQV